MYWECTWGGTQEFFCHSWPLATRYACLHRSNREAKSQLYTKPKSLKESIGKKPNREHYCLLCYQVGAFMAKEIDLEDPNS